MRHRKKNGFLRIPETQNTQERLLEAAIDVFGKQGFNGATTRMIAQTAEVNISAIPYYFSGKEGLYQAAVAHIASLIHTQIYSVLLEIEEKVNGGKVTSKQAMQLLEGLLSGLIDFILGSPEAPRYMRIALREQLDPSEAYEIIYTRLMAPVITTIAKLVTIGAKITDPRKAHLRALMIMGQVLSFRIARETMVRLLGLSGYSPEETAEIRQMILEQTRAALSGLRPSTSIERKCG